ncbi:hypothetical protein HDK77DRAFT_224690 [Phyllosticta capitalensis]
MAVMTSPALDKPSLDAKPVPSQDTMALDSNINGGANDHDPLFDEDPSPHHFDLSDPPPADVAHESTPATNGDSAVNGTSQAVDALDAKDSLPTPADDGNGGIAPTAPTLAENPPDVPQTLPSAPDSLAPTTQPPAIDQPTSNARQEQTESTTNSSVDEKPTTLMDAQGHTQPEAPAQPSPPVEPTPADAAPSAPTAPPAIEPTPPADDSESKMDTTEDIKVEAPPADAPKEETVAQKEEQSEQVSAIPTTEVAPQAPTTAGGDRANVEAATATTNDTAQDHPMEDAPAMTKTRPREEDEEDGPSAKRARTTDGTAEAEAKPAEAPAPAPATNGSAAQPPKPTIETNNITAPVEPAPATPAISSAPEKKKYDSADLTPAQAKFLLDRLRGAKKTKSAFPFLAPVDPVALNIPHYPEVITRPMDLSKMEVKLREKQYKSVDDFISDFYLMIDNCITFNGTQHPIAQTAWNLQMWFERGMHLMPARDAQTEPPKRTKKSSNGPPKARRESRAHVPAHSPKDSNASGVTYALQADGTPLIRRDSTTGDGRPKREIHRPPPKDLPYSNPRPKSKKSQLELRFCDMVINEMLKPKHHSFSYPFLTPVDPIALNIPQYLKIIKKPMDLGTISTRLKTGEYSGAKEVKADIELMFANCFKFNPEGDEVNKMGHLLHDVYKRTWEKKSEWLQQHAPASDPESEEDEEEEEESEDEDEAVRQRQAEIAEQIMKLTQEQLSLQTKKKSSPKYGNKKSVKKEKESKPKKASKPALPLKPKKKQRQITFEEKRLISETIGNLDEHQMARAVQIIRNGVPALQGVNDDELELDIDTIPNDVLHDLLKYIKTVAPDSIVVQQQPVAQDDDYEPPSRKAPTQPRKNKPMGKHEQEAAIADIKQRLQNFNNGGSSDGASPEPTALHRDDSDDDDSSASESEEE